MKIQKIIVFFSILFLFSVSLAQTKKDKKKTPKDQPALTVVEVLDKPPVIPTPTPARPSNGSLFTDSAMNANLLRDFKARQIGDLIFINVVENSEATVNSAANRSRDSGSLGGIVPLVNALPINGAATVGSVLGELGKRKFEGKGSTERVSDVRARIAARVIEVLPNGDLKIEAVKMVRINKETEALAVTGIVRPNDLDKDNAISTVFIGDLRVEFNGKGIASADNAPGWLYRLFDKINPF